MCVGRRKLSGRKRNKCIMYVYIYYIYILTYKTYIRKQAKVSFSFKEFS